MAAAAVLGLSTAATGVALTGPADAADPAGGSGTTRQATSDVRSSSGADTSTAILRLSRDPVATDPSTAPAAGKGLALGTTKARNVRARLAAQRNDLRAWLRGNAPAATVVGEYDIALNGVAVRLNGTPLATLAGAPGVAQAGYAATYAPSVTDPDLERIDAEAAWAIAEPGAPTRAGEGVRIGIVDTGIDATHPCFRATGYPAQKQLGDTRFTNDKVVVARVFANKAAQQGLTPEAVQDHGTHVAGTAACNPRTPASVDGAKIPYAPSGVAPRALLGNYNVFPGDIDNARSEDILDALQAAAEDGMQVLNMSLGGSASGNQDLLTTAVDNLDRANIVVAVAGGNEGPGHFTIGSPGSAERALTAGASSVGHYTGVPVYAGTAATGTPVSVTATGDFAIPTTPLTGTLVPAGGTSALAFGDGCEAGDFTASTTGAIALVARGTCSFGTKVATAEKAGAVGTIVVNNVPGDPVAMAADAAAPATIPAVMAPYADATELAGLAGGPVTIGVTPAYVDSGNDDIMGDFSSQGPTDVSYRVKPDVTAPGVNILSSLPQSFCDPLPAEGCWGFMQGTSMATPHLAGSAAVVRQAHPGWSAAQVRSALVNTSATGVLKQSTAVTALETDPLVTGSGLEDLDAAVGARLALSSVSTSFGAVPSGSGQALTRTLTVTNLTAAPVTTPVSVTGDPAFRVSASTLTVPAGGSARLTLTYAPGKATTTGDRSATLRLGSVAHSVLYAFAR
ncbi:S8 family serine peptidase [Nocardioides aurantiacus]|uniref:S8 family serine peptidase n=1 Tax=Nocardioides aurantiacus TaxID=86796 RepID=UPI000F4A9CB1|nr:S8 family serine peptidase [Nocardioides aurantiacus]